MFGVSSLKRLVANLISGCVTEVTVGSQAYLGVLQNCFIFSLQVTEFISIKPGSNELPGGLIQSLLQDLKKTFGNGVLSNRFPHFHD
jgi:hypothetical protein